MRPWVKSFHRIAAALIGVVAAAIAFGTWVSDRQERLPGYGLQMWIDAIPQGDGTWQLSPFAVDDGFPYPDTDGVVRVQVTERGRGRAQEGRYGSFRHAHWVVGVGLTSDRDEIDIFGADASPSHETLRSAMIEHVEKVVIPSARAHDYWPEIPLRVTYSGNGWWFAGQHRWHWVTVAMSIAVFAFIGALAGLAYRWLVAQWRAPVASSL
ncbi:MAG: hypothetical protein FJ253_11665 [Phycisphaerae bacterium]|nr:hypothetical protein [Phycisphaerae bacterium]